MDETAEPSFPRCRSSFGEVVHAGPWSLAWKVSFVSVQKLSLLFETPVYKGEVSCLLDFSCASVHVRLLSFSLYCLLKLRSLPRASS